MTASSTIGGEVDVQLDPVCAQLEAALEGCHGVFGTVAHRTAVADHPDAPAFLPQTVSERRAFTGV